MTIARRRLLSLGLATTVAALSPTTHIAERLIATPWTEAGLRPDIADTDMDQLPVAEPRRAYLHNLHTGDWLDEVYFADGSYVAGALAEATRVLRDWRNGAEHVIDPRLFDLLHDLRSKLGTTAPFQIISGYRSPATNAMMHELSHEVASGSQHLLGKALDIRVEGVDLARLHDAALSLKAGGVGYYPTSDFVHVDVGAVRQWGGT